MSKRDFIQKLAAHALKRLQDPGTRAEIAAREEKRDRHQELVIVGSRAHKSPTHADVVDIAHLGELTSYLATRESKRTDDRVEFVHDKHALFVRWSSDVSLGMRELSLRLQLTERKTLQSSTLERAIIELLAKV